MTRTKRWVYLASSLAIAAGTGYGGYTQRHLILGEAAPTAAAAEKAESKQAEEGDVTPITVTADAEETASPSRFENPLRGGSEQRVVRGNDEGERMPESGDRFQPPPIQPPPQTPSRFGGSASARVEVEDDGTSPSTTLAPPPTYPSEGDDTGGASAYAQQRFGAPEDNQQAGSEYHAEDESHGNLVTAPVAEDEPYNTAPPPSQFGRSFSNGDGQPKQHPPAHEPTPAAPAANLTPPSRFGGAGENEQIVAGSPAAENAAPASDRFDAESPLPAAPVGSGVGGSQLQNASATRTSLGDTVSTSSQIEGSGQPGASELDGPQAPSLVVEKIAPPEIQIGKPAKFEIKVKNVGQATAENVAVTDQVPQGTRLIDATPQSAGAGGKVVWQLGTLRPGEEKSVSMQLMPVGEGEIGSVATVTFSAQASVRTKATRPQLLLEATGPRQVLIGQPVKLNIRLSNPGTGAATRVVLEEDVPEGLTHPGGRALEFEAGTLKPGETRELELTLSATAAGVVTNVLRARADANLNVESRTNIEVIAPDLAVAVDGPTKRYLERQATHELIISNPGTAPAKNVEMVAHLPKGLKFVGANNQGQYDATSHAVFWSLEQLSPQDNGTVSLTTVPMEAGQQKIRVESKADMNLSTAQEHVVDVEGLAALFFEVADAADPIEVGGETIYEVRVINQGTKTSTNVRVAAALPASLKPIEAGGATNGVITGQQIVFEPLPRLAPKADALFRIRVQGLSKGNQQVRVQLSSDEIPGGVTKEESTRVYADE